MRTPLVILSASLALLLASCAGDDDPTSVPKFSNRLTLGTGTNASNSALTGETSEFRALGGVAVIYWRLECEEDFGGADVSLRIEKLIGGSYTPIDTHQTAANYGHVVVSSISIANAGNFRATGLIASRSTEVASTAFTIQW